MNNSTEIANSSNKNDSISIIEPKSGWQIVDWRELKEYRDLFFFLAWRNIKVLYAQTVLGFAWAIIRPLIQILVFTIIFGKVAQVSSEGVPYFLFSTVAIIPWTYMSQAMQESSQSLISGQGMLGKIYFPRLIFPIVPVLSKLVDFFISLVIIFAVMIYYKVMPTWNLLLIPLMVIYMASIPAGIGLWLSSLAIRFRDVKHAMPFVMQMLLYTAPIVYSASTIPDKYRLIYSLNPLVGIIEGFRACFLGTQIPWTFILPGMMTSVILLVSGAFYFKRMEKIVVDVI